MSGRPKLRTSQRRLGQSHYDAGLDEQFSINGQTFAFLALFATPELLLLYPGVVAPLFARWTPWGAGLATAGWSFLLLITGVPLFWLAERTGQPLSAVADPLK